MLIVTIQNSFQDDAGVVIETAGKTQVEANLCVVGKCNFVNSLIQNKIIYFFFFFFFPPSTTNLRDVVDIAVVQEDFHLVNACLGQRVVVQRLVLSQLFNQLLATWVEGFF